ncbi:MAG: hypothetical protein V1684_02835 [bacterium]
MNQLNQKGQTMLEIIFVLAIVIIGLVGILGLVSANIAGGRVSKTRVVAANLAREGIEATRYIRDSNWLDGDQWDKGLTDAVSYTAIAVFDEDGFSDPATAPWRLEFNPDLADTIMYLNAVQTGVYQQDISPPHPLAKPTVYYRLITLNEICGNRANDYIGEEVQANGARCLATGLYPNKIGIKVESRVGWAEQGGNQEIVVEDRLYNWR